MEGDAQGRNPWTPARLAARADELDACRALTLAGSPEDRLVRSWDGAVPGALVGEIVLYELRRCAP